MKKPILMSLIALGTGLFSTSSLASSFSKYCRCMLSGLCVPHERMPHEILKSWKEVSLPEVQAQLNSGFGLKAFVKLQMNEAKATQWIPIGVYGDLQLIALSDDQFVMVIRDRKNRIHAVDYHSDLISILVPSQSFSTAQIRSVERMNEDRMIRVNRSSLSQFIHSRSPQSGLPARILNHARVQERHLFSTNGNQTISKLVTWASPATIVYWALSAIARSKGLGIDNPMVQHGSNFYFTFVALACVHQVCTLIDPRLKHAGLAFGSAAAFMVNLGSEIDFGGGRWLPGPAGEAFGSDPSDLRAGLLGIFGYLVLAMGIETKHWVQGQLTNLELNQRWKLR